MKLNIIYRRKRELRLVRLHFLSADGSRVALFPRERGGEKECVTEREEGQEEGVESEKVGGRMDSMPGRGRKRECGGGS